MQIFNYKIGLFLDLYAIEFKPILFWLILFTNSNNIVNRMGCYI